MKFLPWNKDDWLSKQGSILPFDKLEHFILAFVGALFLPSWIVSIVSVLWEIKDGMIPYDGVNVQGFSWKDLIADFAGIALAMLL